MREINVYCDESCHLNNREDVCMAFSEVKCEKSKIKEINQRIKDIKKKHNIKRFQEMKWTKISKSNLLFYKDIIEYFFTDDDLSARILLIKNKQDLKFTKTHPLEIFYYKMMYKLIINMLSPENKYYIYLDIKDTNSSKKIKTLMQYLNTKKVDYNVTNTVANMQTIKSYESNLLQIADVLMGALVYNQSNRNTNSAKLEIIKHIQYLSGKSLDRSTLLQEKKFNICIRDGKEMKIREDIDDAL